MKLSKAEMRILVKHFKELVEQDVVGITAIDALNCIQAWLYEVGQVHAGDDLCRAILKYRASPKIEKLEKEYNDSY